MRPESALGAEERLSLRLLALYESWGYRLLKRSRFEEYELYMRNRRFLTDERILTFTDTDGKLMALRPDVTLSVAKNARAEDLPLRVCYTESVFRAPRGGDGFREILQTGVESIGGSGAWPGCEALLLAAKSLRLIREDGWQLDVSDVGIIAEVLSGEALTKADGARILSAIRGKSPHVLSEACEIAGVSEKTRALLFALIGISGRLPEAAKKLSALPLPPACREKAEALREIAEAAEVLGLLNLSLDFSAVNDMSYYNGLIFSGFVKGVPRAVLSGGRYDPLLTRMGKPAQAVGFAVYLEEAARAANLCGEEPETVPVPTAGRRAADIARDMERAADAGKRAAAEEAKA